MNKIYLLQRLQTVEASKNELAEYKKMFGDIETQTKEQKEIVAELTKACNERITKGDFWETVNGKDVFAYFLETSKKYVDPYFQYRVMVGEIINPNGKYWVNNYKNLKEDPKLLSELLNYCNR